MIAGSWSTTDTVTTIAAVAQVSAAIFTGIMARRTHDLAKKTKKMVTETKRVADATDMQAKATQTLVVEAQIDRELSWSPYLIGSVKGSSINSSPMLVGGNLPGYTEQVTLYNAGSGQAVNCYYISRRSTDNYWCWLRQESLAGNESVSDLQALPGTDDLPWDLLKPSLTDPDQTAYLQGALFCEDVFGNRIRFHIGRRGRDVSHPEDEDRPAWATSALVWLQ